MDTLTKSCSPTIVITANGEVQTQEEAIVYVKELDIFLTMKVLENTPAGLLWLHRTEHMTGPQMTSRPSTKERVCPQKRAWDGE